jgi:hypothetical protein
MTFGTFFARAEPHKTYTCQHCSAVVARAPSVWLLLAAVGAVGAAAGVAIGLLGLSAFQAAAVLILLMAVSVVAAKLIAYRWVGWRLVNRA